MNEEQYAMYGKFPVRDGIARIFELLDPWEADCGLDLDDRCKHQILPVIRDKLPMLSSINDDVLWEIVCGISATRSQFVKTYMPKQMDNSSINERLSRLVRAISGAQQ